MCEACESTRREIERLKKWLARTSAQCGTKPRKAYFDRYYAANREKKIAAAKERYARQKQM